MFKNKVLLITGGTGSFGNAILDRFLDSDIREIRIFSRDEKKQDDMRKRYKNAKLKFLAREIPYAGHAGAFVVLFAQQSHSSPRIEASLAAFGRAPRRAGRASKSHAPKI